jgi:type IV secretion system protein VirB10
MSASNPTLNREQGGYAPDGAELENRAPEPQGVIRRNLKLQVYLGIAVLFIIATAVSSLRHKPATKAQGQAPAPLVQDSAANIEEMKRSLEAQQRQSASPKLEAVPPLSQTLGQGAQQYGPTDMPSAYNCLPGQPCPPAPQTGYAQYQQQLSPQQQERMQIEQQEQALAYKSRFASNLAYSQSHAINGPSSLIAPNQPPANMATSDPSSRALGASGLATPYAAALYGASGSGLQGSNLTQPQQGSQSNEVQGQTAYKRAAEVNVNSAAGQPYVIYEGTMIDTALMNRLDGDASGPVKVLVTNPVYSHDHQHVLIPDGTVVLGESRKIGSAGFGHQRRLAVAFHRMIMPDGYSVDLDQFQGLNQRGDLGLKDKVNNHYVQIFGSSIALGIIAGAAEVSNSGGVLTGNGTDAYKYGVAASLSQSATTVLDQFINIPPTITIREGHRVKVYISQDLLLPAYENHTIPSSF